MGGSPGGCHADGAESRQGPPGLLPRHLRVPERAVPGRALRGDPRHPSGRDHLALQALGGEGAGLYGEALALGSRTPCDPRTLTRAERDLAERQPGFAVDAGLPALRWLVHGHGYEITGADVWAAYQAAYQNVMKAAERAGTIAE